MVDNNATEGDYLVRTVGEDTNCILTLIYKSNITHHKLTKTSKGTYAINKKPIGSATTVDALIEFLSKPVAGWPIVLKARIAQGRSATPNVNLRRTSVSSRGGAATPISRSPSRNSGPSPTKPAPQNTFELLSPEAIDESRAPLNMMNPAIAFTLNEKQRISQMTEEKESKRLAEIDNRRSGWLFRTQQAAAKAWTRHAANSQKLQEAMMHLATLTPIETSPDAPSYLWDELHKKKSEEMLSQLEVGAFLVRRKKGDEYTFFLDLNCEFFDEEAQRVVPDKRVVTTHKISRVQVEEILPLEATHEAAETTAEPTADEKDGKAPVVIKGVINMDLKQLLKRLTNLFSYADQTSMVQGSSLPDGQLQKNEILHRLPSKPFADLLQDAGLLSAFVHSFWSVVVFVCRPSARGRAVLSQRVARPFLRCCPPTAPQRNRRFMFQAA